MNLAKDQQKIFNSNSPIVIGVMGRRTGKTTLCKYKAVTTDSIVIT